MLCMSTSAIIVWLLAATANMLPGILLYCDRGILDVRCFDTQS